MDEKTKKIIEDAIAEIRNQVMFKIVKIRSYDNAVKWRAACDQIYEELERDVFGSE